MAKESRQHTLDRVRSPRVQITYDVETGDGSVQKELPFVVAVLGDFAGNASTQSKRLRERNVVNIDPDNFDEVMEKLGPRIRSKVANTLTAEGGAMTVELDFKSMNDFSPESVASQIEPLRKLVEARDKLRDLLNKVDSNEKLEEMLQGVIEDTEKLQKLAQQTEK